MTRTIREIRARNQKPIVSFIVGFPDEKPSDLARTLLLATESLYAAEAESNFLVNLPDNTPGAPNEFVPQGMAYLSAYGSPGGGDEEVHEFTPDEYTYDAASKQVYFKFSQADYKADGYEWKFMLYYYDPDDETNTVKEVFKTILTGEPWSIEGGLGFAESDMTDIAPYDQLEEIAEQLSDVAVVEQQPNLEGRTMLMILAPAKKSGAKKK